MKFQAGFLYKTFSLLGLAVVVLVSILVLSGHLGLALKLLEFDFWILALGGILYVYEGKN